MVQSGAGAGIGAGDIAYQAAGAIISPTAEQVFCDAEMIVKVKEPQKQEWSNYRRTKFCLPICIWQLMPPRHKGRYALVVLPLPMETITDAGGGLPLLAPMSEVAGRLSVIEGAAHLKAMNGGRGLLVSGVPGTEAAELW